MHEEVFISILAVALLLLLRWAFKNLPAEQWQIMAAIPVTKVGGNTWKGTNITYYGLFTAAALVSAVSVIFILMAAIRISPMVTFCIVAPILAICLPAARLVARLVENKPHTFTVGGASFIGLLIAPVVVFAFDSIVAGDGNHVPVIPALAALFIAYGLGEGIGRLACISFGCCYGKPLSECYPWIRKIIGRHSFVFFGKTKKVAYEGGLDGTDVVPIQAITTVLYVAASLAGILLFLKAQYSPALILVTIVTQAWRALSETLRADYRGEGKISAYQIMALLAIVFVGFLLVIIPPETTPQPDLKTGLACLWDPSVILFLQLLGLVGFFYTGRSMVTGSAISFHLMKERI